MITDGRLKVFVTLAECGSFTEAAHLLGCSQPSVSQNIAQLEDASGCRLFLRNKGSVALTPAGERFLGYARRILSLYENLSLEMSGQTMDVEALSLDLGNGSMAEISVREGKLEIGLKSTNN